jgi:hypothetical protein
MGPASAPRRFGPIVTGVVLGLVIALGATVGQPRPTPAHAMDFFYCMHLVPPFTACDQFVGSIPAQGNRATYPGSGTVSVCEKVLRANDGTQISRRCANTTVASGTDLPNGPANNCFVGNNDNGQHTVNGKAVTA